MITDVGVKNINFLFLILNVNSALINFAKITKAKGFLPKIVSDVNIYNQNENLMSIKVKFICSFNFVCILKSIFANYKL